MGRNNRKTSDVVVKIPDFSNELADEFEKMENKPEEAQELEVLPVLGYVENPNGDGLFVFDTEGVGLADPICDKETVIVNVFYSGIKSLTPAFSVSVSAKEMQNARCDEIPLHDFIRSFGRRLENNYQLWEKKLKPTVDVG